MPKPDNIILECVVGSQMYNLDTPESDIDIKGIYVLPTTELISSLNGFRKTEKVIDHTDPDYAYYEVSKYMRTVASGNPTLLELLYANEYTVLTQLGQMLINNREAFLSKRTVKDSYIGYARQQLKRKYRNAADITKYRAGKHCRHIWRLLKQYEQLATTGTLNPRLTAAEREECFAFQEKTYTEVEQWFEDQLDYLDGIKSVLPEKPNYDKIDALLYAIRKENLLHDCD